MRTLKTLLAGTASLTLAFGAAHAAHMAYALGEDGDSLVSFAPDGSGSVTSIDLGIELDAITFRPQTGQLYGYSSENDALYIVDPMTGAVTLEFQATQDLPGGFVSLDFNPTLDAVRIVNTDRANVVYFPANSADTGGRAGTLTFEPTDLFYAEGYTADGAPQVVGNGYTNQVPLGEAGSTIQYVIDAATDTIGILNNNMGSIDFVANLGFDVDLAGGVDVFTSPEGQNFLYALLETDEGLSFYEFDLGTFAVVNQFSLEGFEGLSSLAVFVPGQVVPVPAAAVLFASGAAAFGAARRKKKSA